ncbi:MAG TPA: hypothetical protein VL358_10565 [Caulobacteraceae bacterium]|jgi:hypothetical protein|nr:hypothetical protein [Caulobacteraceae bacterium]
MLTDEKLLDDPRRALQLGLGIYSPLWPTFIAAAGAGVAFWAWAQWARGKAQTEFVGAHGLVAVPPASAFPPVLEPEFDIEPEPEPVAETPPVQAAPEPDPEPVIEAAAPVAETMAPAPAPVETVAPAVEEPAPAKPASAAAKAARRKPAEPEPAPTRKPKTLSAAVSPRKARAAKAAGSPASSGSKRRRKG